VQKRILGHLKTIGFLSLWFSIPLMLLVVFLSPSQLPSVYQTQTFPPPTGSPAPTGVDIFFKVMLKGVVDKNLANQYLFVKAVGTGNQEATFDKAFLWQDENNPELWRGTLNFPQEFLTTQDQATPEATPKLFTFYIKGPVHLQRKFENVQIIQGQELDFTDKLLLPGDVVLPDTGQDDKVDELDRDYLWSLIAKDGRKPSLEEIKAADLDLNGLINSRDYSLLIDTGIGTEGEK
jgi:hypothetical protein